VAQSGQGRKDGPINKCSDWRRSKEEALGRMGYLQKQTKNTVGRVMDLGIKDDLTGGFLSEGERHSRQKKKKKESCSTWQKKRELNTGRNRIVTYSTKIKGEGTNS